MTPMQASRAGVRRVLSAFAKPPPPTAKTISPRPQHRSRSTASTLLTKAAPHLPRILQPSLWATILPPTLRTKARALFSPRPQKPSNPATYFIWIYILIGSQAIRIIQTKSEHQTFSRRAEQQIDKLRDVVRRLQAGEDVDVEKALGTGVPEEEEAWEQALREIEAEEQLWVSARQRKREARERRKREAEEEVERARDASPVNVGTETVKVVEVDGTATSEEPPYRAPGFY